MVELRERVYLSYRKGKAFLAYQAEMNIGMSGALLLILLSGKMTLWLHLKK